LMYEYEVLMELYEENPTQFENLISWWILISDF
jgi:hypothetical protein